MGLISLASQIKLESSNWPGKAVSQIRELVEDANGRSCCVLEAPPVCARLGTNWRWSGPIMVVRGPRPAGWPRLRLRRAGPHVPTSNTLQPQVRTRRSHARKGTEPELSVGVDACPVAPRERRSATTVHQTIASPTVETTATVEGANPHDMSRKRTVRTAALIKCCVNFTSQTHSWDANSPAQVGPLP